MGVSAATTRWCSSRTTCSSRNCQLVELDDHVLLVGKLRIRREGADVTIVSYSIGVALALESAETLAGESIPSVKG